MDMSKYRELFLTETREHLNAMNRLAATLEQTPGDRETVDALFREAHSIKGMAASMGYERTAGLAHHLEDFLAAFRSASVVSRAAIDRLLAGIDLLEGLLDDLQADVPERAIDDFMALPPPDAAPPAEPAGPAADGEQPGPDVGRPSEKRDERVRTVRVRTDLLDRFVNLTGELLTHRHMLEAAVATGSWDELTQALGRTGRLVDALHHDVLQARMMPLESITAPLPRMVRELSRKSGKRVTLQVNGAEVGVDRVILEQLNDPLLHLVRNAVDHGLGDEGTVTVSAWREKDLVLIEVADDGCGMDPERLRRLAVARGFLNEAQARQLADRDSLMLICLPGFSTAAAVTETSGRGVGMDVVKSAIECLGGTLDIQSRPGQGTRFRMRLPLSVAIIRVLFVECAGRPLAIPLTRVQRTLDLQSAAIQVSESRRDFALEEEVLPLLSLAGLLDLVAPAPAATSWVVVTEAQGRPVGLQVDRFLGQGEIFVKNLDFPLSRIPGLSGAAVQGDGRVIFIIDPQTLLEGHAALLGSAPGITS